METLTVVTLVVGAMLAAAAAADSVNFDAGLVGQAPAGWTATRTGSGEAKWTIDRDDTAPSKPNVLKQSGEANDAKSATGTLQEFTAA